MVFCGVTPMKGVVEMEEVWRSFTSNNRKLSDGRDAYLVSNLGNVCAVGFIDAVGRKYSTRRVKKFIDTSNRCSVTLRLENNSYRRVPVASLVAEAFIPNPCGYKAIKFLNGNISDCRAENLVWCASAADGSALKSTIVIKERKTVRQYDLTCKLVAEYKSIGQAQATFGNNNLYKCCTRNYAVLGGYLWRYADDDELAGVYETEWRPVVDAYLRRSGGYFRYEVSRSGVVRESAYTDKRGVAHQAVVIEPEIINGVACVHLLGSSGVKRLMSVDVLAKSAFLLEWAYIPVKPVRQYSLTGKFMNEFKSCEEAAKAVGASSNSILACCRLTRVSHANYLWRSVLFDELHGKTEIELRALVPGVYRQYTQEGQLIAEYASKRAACKAVGRSMPSLDQALSKKGRTCGGFVFVHSSADYFKDMADSKVKADHAWYERKRLSFGWK